MVYRFYSYDPMTRKFLFNETLTVNLRRDDLLVSMVGGVCFSIAQALIWD
jgi:hypothetical protein